MDWSVLIGLFLTAFGKAFAEAVVGIVQGKRNDEANQQLGATIASNVTLTDIGEIADAQARNNAMDRGNAHDVADRLRAELAATTGGNGAGGQGGAAQG